ncbi:MAG: ribosome recycling factor [Desulfobulbaceae bacterium DB1]|nr:MAG: ribosome recycling factor [Desulfobulbaceae bacterium DB1]
MSEVLFEMNDKMEKSLDAYRRELSSVRTGRASLSVLEGIRVDSYGTKMPLNQVATMTIPESRMIVIQPWDPQVLGAIEKAILAANIGLTPANDGKLIRISIPQLTEERRKDLVKQVKKISEEYRVAIRNCRRDALDVLKKQKKDKDISEDDLFKFQEEAQKETDAFIKKIDEILTEKEKEVMEV